MAGYTTQLTNIDKQIKFLKEKQAKLLRLRYQRMGSIAERCGVSTLDDEVLAGVFLEVAEAVKAKNTKLAGWQKSGERFLKPKSQSNTEPVAETAE